MADMWLKETEPNKHLNQTHPPYCTARKPLVFCTVILYPVFNTHI